ncbi:hypothetical protein NL676_010316 [Syzygium grande]|nr:hypothetical protein NL676_010316 [Syzygium grande]
MGMHLVALAKLKLTLVASHSLAPTLAGGLIWPFLLKLSLGPRLFRRSSYADVVQASSLFFFFQLRQIVADSERPASPSRESRLRRAVRLVCQTMASVRRTVAAQGGGGGNDADSLHTLSMIAL